VLRRVQLLKSLIGNSYLISAVVFSILGNIIAWWQMNGQFKYEIAKTHLWVIVPGIIVSYLFYYSTRFSYEYFGNYWAIRPIGFGIATLTFGILTAIVLKEIPSLKIWISLLLSLAIILLNVSNTLDKM